MHRVGIFLAALGAATVLLGVQAPPVSAHVQVQPGRAAPGQLQRYSVEVPNELADQDTVEVDLTLPAGFALDVAQSVPGWQTVIGRRAGVPVVVSWRGGRIPVGTFATFDVEGRNPSRSGPLRWRTVQRYQRTSVDWGGGATSAYPAPVVQLATAAVPAAAAAGSNTTAADPGGGLAVDLLARSRAAAGIAVGVAALGLLLGRAAIGALRRRGGYPDPPPPIAVNLAEPMAVRLVRPGARPGARTVRPGKSGQSRG